MSCTATTLADLCPTVEAQLKPQLSGLFGGFVRAYLPQHWLFRTEQDSATLTVDPNGRATASAVPHPSPDVTVELPHGELRALVAGGGRRRPAPGSIKATAHTPKGRAALGYLGPRLGL